MSQCYQADRNPTIKRAIARGGFHPRSDAWLRPLRPVRAVLRAEMQKEFHSDRNSSQETNLRNYPRLQINIKSQGIFKLLWDFFVHLHLK